MCIAGERLAARHMETRAVVPVRMCIAEERLVTKAAGMAVAAAVQMCIVELRWATEAADVQTRIAQEKLATKTAAGVEVPAAVRLYSAEEGVSIKTSAGAEFPAAVQMIPVTPLIALGMTVEGSLQTKVLQLPCHWWFGQRWSGACYQQAASCREKQNPETILVTDRPWDVCNLGSMNLNVSPYSCCT